LLNCNKNDLSLQHGQKGFTPIEIIVASLIAALLVVSSLAAFSTLRSVFVGGKFTHNVNQRLRGAFSLIGPDIQQTGESLVSDPNFPAIEIKQITIPNTNPAKTSSEIIIRKGLIGDTLPVCQSVAADTNDPVVVTDNNSFDSSCLFNESQDNVKDGIPDIVKRWEEQREQNKGGSIRAYIFKGAGDGEFFDYNGEIFEDDLGNAIIPSATDLPHTVALNMNPHTWQNNYNANSSSRIYLLEDRRYQLQDNTLQLTINDGETLDLVENIDKIEAKATVQLEDNGTEYVCQVIPPTKSGDCTPNLPDNAIYSWAQIKNVEIKVIALKDPKLPPSLANSVQAADLELSQKFFPRNTFSF
jgi:type IV pilus assembly protein PilW